MKKARRRTLDTQLRQAIRSQGVTGYRLSMLSGVAQPIISRFMNGTRDITLTTASKLTDVLNLELQPKRKRKKKKRR